MLMAYPNARLLRLSKYGLEPVSVEQTDHFKIMREFYGDPAGFVEGAIAEELLLQARPHPVSPPVLRGVVYAAELLLLLAVVWVCGSPFRRLEGERRAWTRSTKSPWGNGFSRK